MKVTRKDGRQYDEKPIMVAAMGRHDMVELALNRDDARELLSLSDEALVPLVRQLMTRLHRCGS